MRRIDDCDEKETAYPNLLELVYLWGKAERAEVYATKVAV